MKQLGIFLAATGFEVAIGIDEHKRLRILNDRFIAQAPAVDICR
jgi:hypothetical protein